MCCPRCSFRLLISVPYRHPRLEFSVKIRWNFSGIFSLSPRQKVSLEEESVSLFVTFQIQPLLGVCRCSHLEMSSSLRHHLTGPAFFQHLLYIISNIICICVIFTSPFALLSLIISLFFLFSSHLFIACSQSINCSLLMRFLRNFDLTSSIIIYDEIQ